MSSIDNLNVNSVDDFFNDIADYEEDFSFIQNNESAFYFAKKGALESNSNSSTDDNFEDEVNNNLLETTVSDTDAELKVMQIIITDLSKCVIMDVINGTLQKCDSDADAKEEKDIKQSLIHLHRCLFCNKDYYYFSRGKYCKEHSWKVLGKELRLACICQKGYDVLKQLDPIIMPTNSNDKHNKT
ncbi:hypothetical protein GLOIN_2v1489307 [Rhizophagus clarus]|nr:hypothetical protein GLOIN_2v1489307 [Rhizophagus clarus]